MLMVTNSGAPLLSKFGNLSIREVLVMTSAYVHLSVQTLSVGEGSLKTTPTEGGECEKSRGPFAQPVFFLAGNCMTTVAFEKEEF